MNALEQKRRDAFLAEHARAMLSQREPGVWLPSAHDRERLRTTHGITTKEAAELVNVTEEEFLRLESVDRPSNVTEAYVKFVRSLQNV